MSLWQFSACVEGWNKVHGEHKDTPPGPDELAAAIARAEAADRRRAEERPAG